MAATKKLGNSCEEKAKAPHNPWPPAPLPNDAELPEGTAHDHSPEIPWPKSEAGGALGVDKKPFKNLR